MINVVKAVQDKVSQETSSRTMQHQILEGPLNCLSVNRECSQVVVAGRNVFKVFNVEEDAFTEKCNLRVGKNLNLNFSASDVMWNPVEDHLLASAATNGAVVIWNLNKSSRSKQETVFLEHKRTVHKVCFHGNEPHLLMSGAQDGLMMLFDLRKQGVASVFNGRSECVRDVQFSPHHYFLFGSAFENGNIQLWDMRNPQRAEKQFTAHNGPAFSIDWHPQERYWLGTAGRDKLIKVWDTQNISPVRAIHSVQTIASVARIKWRPNRQYHIASCALLVDFAINVWDVRRPYIPFASFNEHLDVVTGIVWKTNDPHIFLSSSRDSTLYQHVFRDATRPADNANPVSVDIGVYGNIAHSSCDKLTASPTGKAAFKMAHITPISIFRQRPPDRTEQFTSVCSSLSEFETESIDEALSLDWFVDSALGYKLTGRPFSELCDHNARVAISLKRVQVAETWSMLKNLYTDTTSSSTSNFQGGNMSGKAPDMKENNTERPMGSKQHHDSKGSKKDQEFIKEAHGDISTGLSDEDSDLGENEPRPDANLSHIASGMGNNNHSDFFFGDGDVDQRNFEYENLERLQNGRDWTLPNEAFTLRHEIVERGGNLPETLTHKPTDSPSSANESDHDAVIERVNRNMEKNIREDILAVKPFNITLPSMDFVDVVVEILKQYAEKSDIQTAVTALIVLDDKIRPHLDDTTQEQWFTSYIDLLGRFKLWTIATDIIKLSKQPAVSDLNQRSTRLQTNCSKCMKPLQRAGWLCDRCKSVKICSICHLPVKGLYVWCQGCSHGGHLLHMQEWLTQYKQCPAGCGHLCEYTQQDGPASIVRSRGSCSQLTHSAWT